MEMLVVNKEEIVELISQLKNLNENINKIAFKDNTTILYTRQEVKEQYGFSDRAVKKIFTEILKDKVVYIGKEQKLSKRNMEEMLEKGVILK